MLLSLALSAAVIGAPDTLIVKQGNAYGPGVATSWVTTETGVVFTLRDDADVAAVAQTLRERLFNASVGVDGKKITIGGVTPSALLDQVATLSLSGQGDPLGELAALGGVLGGEGPEAGGSIRASKPTAHDPRHRFVARVDSVKRATFPHVTLVLRVKTAAKEGPQHALAAGAQITGSVVFAHEHDHVDFSDGDTQRNLSAFFLQHGDQVIVHVTTDAQQVHHIDYVERTK